MTACVGRRDRSALPACGQRQPRLTSRNDPEVNDEREVPAGRMERAERVISMHEGSAGPRWAAVAAAAMMVMAGAALLAGAGPAAAATAGAHASAAMGGTWGNAQEVPGSGALNASGAAGVNSVSCASVGNCVAGGYYDDSSGDTQPFVAAQVNGTWGDAQQIPGIAALSTNGFAEVTSVSCPSAGNCTVGGYYSGSSFEVFVASEVNGTWRTARPVPGKHAVLSVSCGSAGNCAAGGSYLDSSGNGQVFVLNENNGTWGKAKQIPGTAALNTGGIASVDSLSCATAGNCAAAGFYGDSSGGYQAFVVNEVNGTWGDAQEIPGTAALNTGGDAVATSVSCPSAGNCAAGGYYAGPDYQAFVVNQTPGG